MPETSATQQLEAEPRLPEPALPAPAQAAPLAEAEAPFAQAEGQAAPQAAPRAGEGEDEDLELARLESLLYARTQQSQTLSRELARCDRLLREALVRMPTLAGSELHALRRGYDAAVERAVEAEVARAELTFALDETRAQLTAAGPSAATDVRQPGAPGVYARVAELEEAEGNLHARLVLAEQDRDSAQQRLRGLTRELQEASERAELLLSREHALSAAIGAHEAREHVLRAHAAGLGARAGEAELAFQSAYGRAQLLEQRAAEAQARLAQLQAEAAEQAVRVQAHAARIEELQRALSLEQQEVRSLRGQVAAAEAAQRQQNAARETDEAQWAERVRQLSEREQEATRAGARAEEQLREFLGSLEKPLRELDGSLDRLGPDARVLPLAEALRSDSIEPPADAARLTDELAKERSRRRKLGVTVRALQAASESGEPTGPWIQELLQILAEGASLPPGRS